MRISRPCLSSVVWEPAEKSDKIQIARRVVILDLVPSSICIDMELLGSQLKAPNLVVSQSVFGDQTDALKHTHEHVASTFGYLSLINWIRLDLSPDMSSEKKNYFSNLVNSMKVNKVAEACYE